MSGYCNIYNIIDLRVAGATVYGHLRCPDIAILIILLACELQVRQFMDTHQEKFFRSYLPWMHLKIVQVEFRENFCKVNLPYSKDTRS